ncbi:hypothetical protein M2152_002008 [Microbacteriaceae bacterium SG_E_30_P1]|uniref:Helix-turn-helix domain-containing protein n=1 Tax=Antiquaquibacter oligotrophicus TaxID=2880260 RepID=A0ABT6KPU3_9MICO|nr:hypothetical protein [Antiquaquibacter oligotrophicus]MDH6181826.1 hypothetical protein [Antiquaquibacter oligotrophicus]UDF12496.1 hypothetical protein LH407_10065 [Antiquaquibacter oligotrophicus]
MADARIKRVKLSFERNYTQMPNEWHRDPQLSLRARGLLGLLMSHDENYIVSVKSLVAQNPEGREAIEGAMRELKAKGYLRLHTKRGVHGRVDGWIWELTDPVEAARQDAANRLQGFPDYGSAELRKSRGTAEPHLKEQHQKELTQVKDGDPRTRAGEGMDASGGSPRAATETREEKYARLQHQPCPWRKGAEHDFAPGKPCSGCGIHAGQYLDENREVRYLSDLLEGER